MAYFRDGDELGGLLEAFFRSFLASAEGAHAAEQFRRFEEEDADTTLRLTTVDPRCELLVDFAARTVVRDPAGPAREPAVEVVMDADTLHDFWLSRLDPVQIAAAQEAGRIEGRGHPLALAALIPIVGALEPHYRQRLEVGGRDDLLATPLPPTKVVWQKEERRTEELIGRGRPWQSRGAAEAEIRPPG